MKNSARYSAWQCGKHERKGISHLGPNIYTWVPSNQVKRLIFITRMLKARKCKAHSTYLLLASVRPFPHICCQKVLRPFPHICCQKVLRPFPHWVPTRIRGCHQNRPGGYFSLLESFKTLCTRVPTLVPTLVPAHVHGCHHNRSRGSFSLLEKVKFFEALINCHQLN